MEEYRLSSHDTVGIELRVNFYQQQPVQDYTMPSLVEVQMPADERGTVKIVRVEVEREIKRKPFIGGFRHKETGQEYHNANAQTMKQILTKHVDKFHRDAQTYEWNSKSIQPQREAGTQMLRAGAFISNKEDKIIYATDHYQSSEELHAIRVAAAITIQRFRRGFAARTEASRRRSARAEISRLAAEEDMRQEAEAELRHKRELERRMHPRTHIDFATLYDELESWRVSETNRIKKSSFDDATKHAALRELLAKETALLQTIGRLRVQATKLNKDEKVKKELESCAKPKMWAMDDGETVTVHTPLTTRAKELLDLYNGLKLPLLTVDERLDVLLHVKWTVKEFDCNLTREIVDLIDREADTLHRGRPQNTLKGLRQRLANLFLQFVRTPQFNPEAQRFVKVPSELYSQSATALLSTVCI